MNFAHQQNLFDPSRARKVTLLGAGSVGSHTALFLAKMGVTSLTVWDGDTVSSHNLPMSLYRTQDVARPKVEALKEIIFDHTGVEITVRPEMYEGQALKNTSVVSCVDTMAARQSIWEQVKYNPTVDLFLDTRIAGAYVEVLAIEPNIRDDIEQYEALLFPDSAAAREYCGRHGIVFAATRAAGIVSANLATFWEERTKAWRVAERCDTLERVI